MFDEGSGDQAFNQHLADGGLVHSVEISDDQSVSKMSNSHLDMKDDNKSMKSFKSKGSIRSEVPVAQQQDDTRVNTYLKKNQTIEIVKHNNHSR